MADLTLGIDIGGTFTDLVLVRAGTNQVFVGKTLTTPREPTEGVLRGLIELLQRNELAGEDISRVIHATTLITNAIIERKGARVGFITTAGFRDLLEIGREVRYDLYDLFLEMPEQLVPRSRCVEVRERINGDGTIIEAIDTDGLRVAIRQLVDAGVDSIAVGFLHSYINDAHEQEAARIIAAEYPHLSVSISSNVTREIREYERFCTTVVNSYVQPLSGRYFHKLTTNLKDLGFAGALQIMLSNGGVVTAETASELPVRLVESGPAAGALIAGYYGNLSGSSSVLAFDMGGTTAKLCLVDDGRPTTTYTLEVGRVHRFKRGSGLPIRAPSVELVEIGAGGGSIAHLDELGLLVIGPESASSDPGPACYGFGGTQPTVTDADLVLGYLNQEYFLGGTMQLNPDAARDAIRCQLAKPLGLDVTQVAWGIHDMVNENMATAASVYIAEKGRDPRHFSLVATGGAGPVHAVEVARKIGLKTVIIPPAAGVASATGLLIAPPRMDFAHSFLSPLVEVNWQQTNAILGEMETQGRIVLDSAGVSTADVVVSRIVDMRYANQGHEVPVALPAGELDPDMIPEIVASFEKAYQAFYGRIIDGVPLEVVTWRLAANGPAPKVSFASDRSGLEIEGKQGIGELVKGQRACYFPELGDFINVNVYNRYALAPGACFNGPAIIEEEESTIVIGPQDSFKVDKHSMVAITLAPRKLAAT